MYIFCIKILLFGYAKSYFFRPEPRQMCPVTTGLQRFLFQLFSPPLHRLGVPRKRAERPSSDILTKAFSVTLSAVEGSPQPKRQPKQSANPMRFLTFVRNDRKRQRDSSRSFGMTVRARNDSGSIVTLSTAEGAPCHVERSRNIP